MCRGSFGKKEASAEVAVRKKSNLNPKVDKKLHQRSGSAARITALHKRERSEIEGSDEAANKEPRE